MTAVRRAGECEALTPRGICGRPTDERGYCGHERDHIEDEHQAREDEPRP